jgi:hypothetical protein
MNPDKITPAIRWKIVNRLLHPESMAVKGAVGREIKFLKMLEKLGYTDPDFWLNWNPGFQVRSLIWFRGDGASCIRQAWGLYQISQNEKKVLEQKAKEETMAKIQMIKSLGTVAGALAAKPPEPSKPKPTMLDWVDGNM